jgi:hypothetical protein
VALDFVIVVVPMADRVENNPVLGIGAPASHSYAAGIPG